MATTQQPDSFKSSPAYVKAGWEASRLAVRLRFFKICFLSDIWYQKVMRSGNTALWIRQGKRGQENKARSPNISQRGKVVWVVQSSAPCPKSSFFLNTPFLESWMWKKEGQGFTIGFLISYLLQVCGAEKFLLGEFCKHRHKTHHYSCFYLKLPIIRVIFSEFVSEFQFHTLTIYSCLKITFGW